MDITIDIGVDIPIDIGMDVAIGVTIESTGSMQPVIDDIESVVTMSIGRHSVPRTQMRGMVVVGGRRSLWRGGSGLGVFHQIGWL